MSCVTRFLSETGIAEITDFMPILKDDVPNQLIRPVQVIQGKITFKLECWPAFDYARRKQPSNVATMRWCFVPRARHSADGAAGVDSA